MNILLAASEVVPYAKTGGLADVAGALPKALARLGHNVRVVMPRYNLENILKVTDLAPFKIRVPFRGQAKESDLYVDTSGEAPVYFLDEPHYFFRPRLYGEWDDGERFAWFSRAIVELMKSLPDKTDVVHLNDWMTGLAPVYMRTVYSGDPQIDGTGILFTIHNLAFHGLFGAGLLPIAGLPTGLDKTEGGLEFYGELSSLKGGIVFSDAVSTVSPKYSQEIQTPEFGERFDGLLRSRSKVLYGILNGVDYDEWSPAADPYIAARYSPSDMVGKIECKRDLLRSFSLPEEPHRPIIGCISRLSDQKGFDLLLDIVSEVLDRGVILVLLGSGAEFYEKKLQALKASRPSRVGLYLGYSNELAHKIEAGADMFLMPSRFEPCGLNQMYSLKYGSVPIVRAAGGLDDTIEQFNGSTGKGNGFKFYEYSSGRLLEKILEAISVYRQPDQWRKLVANGMGADFSWEQSARHYVDLYETLSRQTTAAAV